MLVKSDFSPARAIPGDAVDPRGLRLGDILLRDGVVTQTQLDHALTRQRRHMCRLGDLLVSQGLLSEDALFDALARQSGVSHARAADTSAAPDLIDRLGVRFCARNDLLPLRRAGRVSVVATANPRAFEAMRPTIEDRIGPVAMVVMTPSELRNMLQAVRATALVKAAETKVPDAQACRSFGGRSAWIVAMTLITAICAALWAAPVATVAVFLGMAAIVTVLNTALLLVAMHVPMNRRADPDATDTLSMARLPRVSILVPLFQERRIASELVERLSRLQYPTVLLDVCLVVEACDTVTADTLTATDLPRWMRVISVPDGCVRTKPRAMNYALEFCAGDVIGIYDAEDAPPADQILRVVHQFARSRPEVACLQGRLNFYNPGASWLTRCFAIDYAVWFHLVLPAMHRLGWALPLGGTTVFFRRDALENVGGWDAHNVTEDADLGIRLARHGYRTDLLPSMTLEEATSGARAWVNQRSRWQKGYAVTWLVHMRNPVRLLRDLGAWRFFGFQMLFLGSLGGTLLAPVLWSVWLLNLGLPHPLQGMMGSTATFLLVTVLMASVLVCALAQLQALRRMRRIRLALALPLMHAYYPLATVALVKAMWELVFRPFYWDKTDHGITPPDTHLTEPDPETNRA